MGIKDKLKRKSGMNNEPVLYCNEMDEKILVETIEAINSLSVLQTMERIAELSEDSRLSDDFFRQIEPYADKLSSVLNISPVQAVIYSIFVDNYYDHRLQLSDIRRHTGARLTKLVQYQGEIDDLVRKRYIRRSGRHPDDRDETTYSVPQCVLSALRENRAYEPPRNHNVNFSKFARCLEKIVAERYERGGSYEIFEDDCMDIVEGNQQLSICRALTKINEELEDSEDWLLLVAMCAIEMFHGGRLGIRNFSKIFNEQAADLIILKVAEEIHPLQKMGLIEFGFADGMIDKDCVQLSLKAKKSLLKEFKFKPKNVSQNLLASHSIAEKTLCYNETVEREVDRLEKLLMNKNFKGISNRMRSAGMKAGFTCLFYGDPGTGKTETVLQLARKTGRNIMQVDFSTLRDKYVGESEKNLQAVFDSYRDAVENEKLCPILFFNEADAIIGKRFENVLHSVDKMENAMQNILLQEMETFEGILIATTNLQNNFDGAFERRFLFKLQFEKPDVSVRMQIWKSIMPNLADDVAMALAKEYDFSGGQIQNIARKLLVDELLYGTQKNIYGKLKEYCENEKISNGRKRIGF